MTRRGEATSSTRPHSRSSPRPDGSRSRARTGAPGQSARRMASMTSTTMKPDDRYTIISSDCHAGANHETYREYLDPKYRDDFDAWREKYKNPFRDLQDGGRIRNWDDERRIG